MDSIHYHLDMKTINFIFYQYIQNDMTDKEDTIKNVYENKITGYGSVRDTFLQAHKINPDPLYAGVKDY